jgi:hypothetical protein
MIFFIATLNVKKIMIVTSNMSRQHMLRLFEKTINKKFFNLFEIKKNLFSSNRFYHITNMRPKKNQPQQFANFQINVLKSKDSSSPICKLKTNLLESMRYYLLFKINYEIKKKLMLYKIKSTFSV